MKKTLNRLISVFALLLFALSAFCQTTFAESIALQNQEYDFLKKKLEQSKISFDSIIVSLKNDYDSVSNSDIEKKLLKSIAKGTEFSPIDKNKLEKSKLFDENHYKRVVKINLKTPGIDQVAKAILDYEKLNIVECAEPNYIFENFSTTPNDPLYSEQYAFEKISLPEAWDVSTGSSEVVVGVIDSGIGYEHPDLTQNLWTNPGEIPDDGIDNDENGYIDDVHGIAFYGNGSYDNDPKEQSQVCSHGTHVSGIIGAVGNNNIGVSGVNWQIQIAPVGNFTSLMGNYPFDTYNAINYCIVEEIPIINLSQGGTESSAILKNAIDSYTGLIIAAAGNENEEENKVKPHYPAAYPNDNIISVANSDENDNLAEKSAYGSTVDLAAPGENILSTVYKYEAYGGITYQEYSGTSMAAPMVTGVAALIKSVYPDLTPLEIKERILNSVDKLESLNGKVVTGGRLNAYKALTYHESPPDIDISLSTNSTAKEVTVYPHIYSAENHFITDTPSVISGTGQAYKKISVSSAPYPYLQSTVLEKTNSNAVISWKNVDIDFNRYNNSNLVISGYYRTDDNYTVDEFEFGKPNIKGTNIVPDYDIISSDTQIISDNQWHYFYIMLAVNEPVSGLIFPNLLSWGESSSDVSGEIEINALKWQAVSSDYNDDFTVLKWAEGIRSAEYFQSSGINITGNSFQSPNSETYTIYAKDIFGNEALKHFHLNNIDRLGPEIATVVDNGNTFSIQANDTDRGYPLKDIYKTTQEDFEYTSYSLSFNGANWSRTDSESINGAYSYTNNQIEDNQSTSSQCTIFANGDSNVLSFYYKVSSEIYDYFNVYIDGIQIVHQAGETNWTLLSKSLSYGSHTIKFEYVKNGSVSDGEDCCYIDALKLETLDDVSNRKIFSEYEEKFDTSICKFDLLDEKWVKTTSDSFSGSYSLKNQVITHNQSARDSIHFKLSGECQLSFYYKVSSETNYDYFNVYLDGVKILSKSGEVPWTKFNYTFESTALTDHILKIEYKKDGSISKGSDCAYIDDLKLQTYNNQSISASGCGATNVNGIYHVKYKIDNGPLTVYSGPVAINRSVDHIIHVYNYDNAGTYYRVSQTLSKLE